MKSNFTKWRNTFHLMFWMLSTFYSFFAVSTWLIVQCSFLRVHIFQNIRTIFYWICLHFVQRFPFFMVHANHLKMLKFYFWFIHATASACVLVPLFQFAHKTIQFRKCVTIVHFLSVGLIIMWKMFAMFEFGLTAKDSIHFAWFLSNLWSSTKDIKVHTWWLNWNRIYVRSKYKSY